MLQNAKSWNLCLPSDSVIEGGPPGWPSSFNLALTGRSNKELIFAETVIAVGWEEKVQGVFEKSGEGNWDFFITDLGHGSNHKALFLREGHHKAHLLC